MQREKTLALVLRRTNFAEADRIVNLLTPSGKISAIARGVRKQKSKLAGGIEFFSLNEIVFAKGKSEMKTLISARMKTFFGEIVNDFDRTEFAYFAMKKLAILAENVDSPEFFELLLKTFEALNSPEISLNLTKIWFNFRLAEIAGEDINLKFDKNGEPLLVDENYSFDIFEKAFFVDLKGEFNANHIKFLRLLISSEPRVISKVAGCEKFLNEVSKVVNSFVI